MENALFIDEYIPPCPVLPENRFWLPIRVHEHAVIALQPCSDKPVVPIAILPWDGDFKAVTDDQIDEWDLSPCNVALICGKSSGVTVLEVAAQSAQLWLDQHEVPHTPQWLSRRARYYLFSYSGAYPERHTQIGPGLRILNDGAGAIYPGSIYEDGRLVHWEVSPDFADIADLPDWLLPSHASKMH